VINNVVYSGILIPGLIFASLLAVPWIERRLSGDDTEHNLLDRPRDAAIRTAMGVACLTVVALLFLGGSQDVIAGTFDMSIGHVTAILQISLLVAPPFAGIVTWRLCRTVAGRPAPERTERAGLVVRDSSGGYRAGHEDEVGERMHT
jgi:quinol---cytochrome-c reductase cytochrome b subunit